MTPAARTFARVLRAEAMAAGETFYFTGEACRRGHVADRYVKSSQCVVCNKLRYDQWRKAKPDKAAAILQKWKKKNPEKRREVYRNWAARNPEKISAQGRNWRQQNPERARNQTRKWRKENPDQYRALCQLRRTRKLAAGGKFCAADIERIRKQQRNRCAYYSDCGQSFKRRDFQIDHIVAVANGGSSWPNNIQLLCAQCNRRKNKIDALKYARRQGRLL